MARRMIEFDDADLSAGALAAAEVLLHAPVTFAIERAGFVVEQVEEPTDLAGEIVRAMTSYNDSSTATQNTIARIVRLGRMMLEAAEAQEDPFIVASVTTARAAIGIIAAELPAEGYATAVDLQMRLALWERYLWENGYGERRFSGPGGQGGTRGGGARAGADPGGDRGPGDGARGPGGDDAATGIFGAGGGTA